MTPDTLHAIMLLHLHGRPLTVMAVRRRNCGRWQPCSVDVLVTPDGSLQVERRGDLGPRHSSYTAAFCAAREFAFHSNTIVAIYVWNDPAAAVRRCLAHLGASTPCPTPPPTKNADRARS